MRFTKIDKLTRPNHHFLNDNDECFYMGEYTARAGFNHSDTNQLIYNIKIPMNCKGTGRWSYKTSAIQTAANQMQKALKNYFDRLTIVPMPPSKIKSDSEYDDRIVRMVEVMCGKTDADIRELVLQQRSLNASHETDKHGNNRTTIDELVKCYELDADLCNPPREIIAVFDDVITTGTHFKAMKTILQQRFPETRIVGFFIARVVPNSDMSFE